MQPIIPHNLRKHGFTLIELLVVIAIISLLVSILLPSLQNAKELARTLQCATQLRAFGSSYSMYATDYDGNMPSYFEVYWYGARTHEWIVYGGTNEQMDLYRFMHTAGLYPDYLDQSAMFYCPQETAYSVDENFDIEESRYTWSRWSYRAYLGLNLEEVPLHYVLQFDRVDFHGPLERCSLAIYAALDNA